MKYKQQYNQTDGELMRRYRSLSNQEQEFFDSLAGWLIAEVGKSFIFGLNSALLLVLRYEAGMIIPSDNMQYAEQNKKG